MPTFNGRLLPVVARAGPLCSAIRAIEITDNAIGDAPMLPELLAQIPADEQLHSVSADGAYDTKACARPSTAQAASQLARFRKP